MKKIDVVAAQQVNYQVLAVWYTTACIDTDDFPQKYESQRQPYT